MYEIIAAVILIIIVILYFIYRSPDITGVWVGDHDYCSEAGIDYTIVAFDGKYAIIYVCNEGEIVVSITSEYTISGLNITLKEVPHHETVIPRTMSIKKDKDRLVLYDKKTAYFAGFKSPELSSLIT